jgi:acyl carrier protein
MYATGDLGKFNRHQEFEYLGRKDRQVKVGGIRVELGEIEAALSRHSGIQQVAVTLQEQPHIKDEQVAYCITCGLPSNYPGEDFIEGGTCSICESFSQYQRQASQYFREEEELKQVLDKVIKNSPGEYDCLALLSGGKDSTYALARLVDMGYKVLSFTLDNGYISEQAKANINRVVKTLGVDHVFGKTEAMNAIFVDSLNRHCNVCNGCFKTIYTLSTNLAVEKGIPLIVTGLSRGQLFETRLTEELFTKEQVNAEKIDETILQARKAYHQTDDAVNRLLDVSVFEDGKVFEQVQYVDFYRYCDVELDQMLAYLDQHLPWVRPSDTGRSTNCVINQVGIYVHRKQKGYSNYAFPYSWDVRIGHKTRNEAVDEVNEEIDEKDVFRIMDEIGYSTFESLGATRQLVAYYTGPEMVDEQEIRQLLAQHLPAYMIPNRITWLEEMPVTTNGKVDYRALSGLQDTPGKTSLNYRPPTTQIEQMLVDMWEEVLQLPRIGVLDNFIHLGGNSLTAIRLISRINERFHLEFPLNKIFEFPTISDFGALIDETISRLLEAEP